MWSISISVSGSGSLDIADNEVDSSRHMAAALSGQPSFGVTVSRLKSVECIDRYTVHLMQTSDIFEFS